MMSKLTQDQIDEQIKSVTGWKQEGDKIMRTVETKSFSKGIEIINLIEPSANGMNHHPDIVLTYPRLVINLTTHDEGGLTMKDFELAATIDKLLEPTPE